MTDSPLVKQTTAPTAFQRPRFWRLICIAIVAGLLVACADDSGDTEDRRFANQPFTEAPVAATPSRPSPVTSPPTRPPEASPEALLDAPGAPGTVYALIDGSIQVIDATGTGPGARIEAPSSRRFVAIAPSPAGDRVAALTMPAGQNLPEAAEVAVYDFEGQVLNQWPQLTSAGQEGATPVADTPAGQSPDGSISWAPEGDRLLVALGGTTLVTIDIDGEASVLPLTSPIQRIVHAGWSPRGDQIAFLARNLEGSGVVWVFDPYVDGISLRQVAPPNADAANLGSVTAFAWMPDGSGLIYILSEEAGANAVGGQVYTINLKLGVRLLVATPGRGGPAAEIVDFAVSPDGKAVAYTIAIPSGDAWQFHSLWVRSITMTGLYNVPAGTPERIDRLWWADPGIVWRQQSGDIVDIVAHSPSEDLVILYTLMPGATGTPGATPNATPILATPVATPVAGTPIAGTPAP